MLFVLGFLKLYSFWRFDRDWFWPVMASKAGLIRLSELEGVLGILKLKLEFRRWSIEKLGVWEGFIRILFSELHVRIWRDSM